MNKRYAISRALAGLLAISAGAAQGNAEVLPPPPLPLLSDVALSAANCIPREAGSFDGSGASGFRWDDDGAFVNADDDQDQDLICAVPYDLRLRRAGGAIPAVEVIVNVIDRHDGNEVRVDGYHQQYTAVGPILTNRFGSASTTDPYRGRTSLTVSFDPLSDTKYIWIRISVPDSDNFGLSGVAGYRVRRR